MYIVHSGNGGWQTLPLTVKELCKTQFACRSIDYGGNELGDPSKRGRTAVGATRIGLGAPSVLATTKLPNKSFGSKSKQKTSLA